jgi:cation diffusion facilitator CzcD-associated flavoprotein CzcO
MNGMDAEHHDIVIIGAGFAGLGMAIGLQRQGIRDFVVLERADSVGGTWRANRYPGCGCDVPAPLYSFSFAQNPDWSRLYAPQEEIRAYLEDCTDRFGVRGHLRFGAEMTGAEWDEERERWMIELADGARLSARLLLGGFGGLSEPAYPDIEGLRDFGGRVVHTADWPEDLDLTGRHVAVIGTGASAIQLVPQAAKVAAHVDVFQRTPPWIVPKRDQRIGRSTRRLFRRLPVTQRALRGFIFALTESVGYPITRRPQLLGRIEQMARSHLHRQVPDVALRSRLEPSYRIGCKRILVSGDYYPALCKPGVELVTEPIARISERGVVTADGVEHVADILVCSTGFDIAQAFTRMSIRGRGGVRIADVWSPKIEAHRGTMVAGFPNFMLMSGPNTGTGSTSQVYMIEAQIHYILEALAEMRRTGTDVVEVRREAQDAYNRWLQERMRSTVWLTGGCNSWYLDENGHNSTLYPGLSSAFRRSLRGFRASEHILEPQRRHAPVHPEPVAA